VGTDTWKNNDVIKAFGQLPYELIAQFPNVQVFGAVGTKLHPHGRCDGLRHYQFHGA
jgi:hypothetical protein